MAHKVKCYYCGKIFDRDKEPFIQINSRRYAHIKCGEKHQQDEEKINNDKINLENYIKKLFNVQTIDTRIQKQIKQYIEKYNFSYSGIHKALIYHYEVKGGSIDKSNGGIGIVPYVYQNAYRYYYSLWEAQQKNLHKDVQSYQPIIKEITIKKPKRNIKKRVFFSFLDQEG